MHEKKREASNVFLNQIIRLLESPLPGVSFSDKLDLARNCLNEFNEVKSEEEVKTLRQPTIKIIHQPHAFVPVEHFKEKAARYKTVGIVSTAVLRQEDEFFPDTETDIFIPYKLLHLENIKGNWDSRDISIDMSVKIKIEKNGKSYLIPIPRWSHVPLHPKGFLDSSVTLGILKDVDFSHYQEETFVALFSPSDVLLPMGDFGNTFQWCWDEIDPMIKETTPDGRDLFTFAHLYHQVFQIELNLKVGDHQLSSDFIEITIFDISRAGSWLYRRCLEDLVWLDTEKQKIKLDVKNLDYSYHPFFPVLVIGMDKAKIYLQGIINELKYQKEHIDPYWLLLVSVYLEMLTCIGLFEAVKDEFPDLITPEERVAFESSPRFDEIRKRANIEGWKEIWKLHDILPALSKAENEISVFNIMKKKETILAFLHMHHLDLKNAIELAGKNTYRFQETFQRVFRDAERAVIKNGKDIFPEILFLNKKLINFLFWHEQGIKVYGFNLIPSWLTFLYGDRDGIYVSAAKEYRKSMNEVSLYAKNKGLVDYTGEECIPLECSLINCYVRNNKNLLRSLQDIDGYAHHFEPIDSLNEPLISQTINGEHFTQLTEKEKVLKLIPVFQILLDQEIKKIAHEMTYVEFQPHRRLLVQGELLKKIFLLHSGIVHRYVRNESGQDIIQQTFYEGDLIGIDSVILQSPTSYTAMTATPCSLFEIPGETMVEITRKRPVFLYQLAISTDLKPLEFKSPGLLQKIASILKKIIK